MGQGSRGRNDQARPPPLGVIEVIYTISKGVSLSKQKGILSVAFAFEANSRNQLEKKLRRMLVLITFYEVDLEGTS